MANTLTSPVASSDRAIILDVLRGLALLGIFLNNIYAFSGYAFLSDAQKQPYSTDGLDRVVDYLQITLVEGKFYSLFSLLFGIGFSIFLIRGQQKGIPSLKVFYRRISILLLIGAVHLYGFWEGDILLLYALIGLFLPLFRKCSNKQLLTWAAILILSPVLIDVVKLLLHWTPGQILLPIGVALDGDSGITEQNWRTFLFSDSSGFHEWRQWQKSAFVFRYQYILDSNRIMKVLGLFLLGFWAGRNQVYAKLNDYRPLLKKMAVYGFAIGLPFCIAMAYFERDEKFVPESWMGLADTITYALGVVPLSLAYAGSVALLWLRSNGSFLKWVAPAGRMALTNYLTQTLAGIFIFYGVGLGLGQQFGLTYCFLFVLLFFCLQVLFSRMWLNRFNYGPMEWIWRQLTYGKRLPLKKEKATPNLTDTMAVEEKAVTAT